MLDLVRCSDSIFGLSPLDASTNLLPPVVRVKNVSRHHPASLGREPVLVRLSDLGLERGKGS